MKNINPRKSRNYFFLCILALAFYCPIPLKAQTSQAEMDNNKQAVRTGFENWAHAKGSFFDLLADSVQWTITGHTPYSKTYTSKRQFLDQVIKPLNLRLSKTIMPVVRGIYADGDMVIALWDGVATAKDGKPYNTSYSWYMEMRNGKIFKVVAFLDGIEFADLMKRIPVDN